MENRCIGRTANWGRATCVQDQDFLHGLLYRPVYVCWRRVGVNHLLDVSSLDLTGFRRLRIFTPFCFPRLRLRAFLHLEILDAGAGEEIFETSPRRSRHTLAAGGGVKKVFRGGMP